MTARKDELHAAVVKWSTQQPYYNAKRGVPLTAMFKEAKLPFVGSSPTCRSISLGTNSNSK